MSRSYKKNPVVTDNKGGKNFAKRKANKEFRRKISSNEEMPHKPQHKKYTESYNVCDYKSRMTYKEAVIWYYLMCESSIYFNKRYPTLKKWLMYWDKCYNKK